MTIILATILALAFLVGLVATLEHLDCRAREQRWQRALASMQLDDTRTPLTDPVTTRVPRGEYGVTSCGKVGS